MISPIQKKGVDNFTLTPNALVDPVFCAQSPFRCEPVKMHGPEHHLPTD
jgi:hypothetical protein